MGEITPAATITSPSRAKPSWSGLAEPFVLKMRCVSWAKSPAAPRFSSNNRMGSPVAWSCPANARDISAPVRPVGRSSKLPGALSSQMRSKQTRSTISSWAVRPIRVLACSTSSMPGSWITKRSSPSFWMLGSVTPKRLTLLVMVATSPSICPGVGWKSGPPAW